MYNVIKSLNVWNALIIVLHCKDIFRPDAPKSNRRRLYCINFWCDAAGVNTPIDNHVFQSQLVVFYAVILTLTRPVWIYPYPGTPTSVRLHKKQRVDIRTYAKTYMTPWGRINSYVLRTPKASRFAQPVCVCLIIFLFNSKMLLILFGYVIIGRSCSLKLKGVQSLQRETILGQSLTDIS